MIFMARSHPRNASLALTLVLLGLLAFTLAPHGMETARDWVSEAMPTVGDSSVAHSVLNAAMAEPMGWESNY